MPILILLIIAGAIAYWVLSRANEIFCISVRDGQCLVIRGRVSAKLLAALSDIARRAQVERATIRAVRQGGRARLVVSGVDEAVAQRMRNAFGASGWSKARFGEGQSEGSRNLGQLLGIAWLAWLLTSRR